MPYNEPQTYQGDIMNTKITTVKNHIHRNRAKYAAAGTLIACLALQREIAKQWNEFLDEHDLKEAYWADVD